jgi:hypothetical protein
MVLDDYRLPFRMLFARCNMRNIQQPQMPQCKWPQELMAAGCDLGVQSLCWPPMAAGDVPMAQLPTGWSIARIATATAMHWQKDFGFASKFFPFPEASASAPAASSL